MINNLQVGDVLYCTRMYPRVHPEKLMKVKVLCYVDIVNNPHPPAVEVDVISPEDMPQLSITFLTFTKFLFPSREAAERAMFLETLRDK